MTGRQSLAAVEQAVQNLSQRDRLVLLDLARVRLLTGHQLTRLHFHNLSSQTRERMRRRVLSRLISIGLVATLERQIGGARSGSSGLIYALSSGGQRALAFIAADAGMEPPNRPRKPWTPGLAFLGHTLDISELYVQLVAAHRSGQLVLRQYLTEAAAWFGGAIGGILKPDAYAVVQGIAGTDFYAIEVDRATESLPTIRRKLLAYVDFAHAGQLGPDGVMPHVLVTVPHERRLLGVRGVITGLPEPAGQLVRAVPFTEATGAVVDALKR